MWLCHLMCGKASPFQAAYFLIKRGCASRGGTASNILKAFVGKPKAFRTSSG